MALVAVPGLSGSAIGWPTLAGPPESTATGFGTIGTIDATNEAVYTIGRVIWEDGASHTVDTSGSSKIEFSLGTVTFANAGTTAVVGIADADQTTGPVLRPVNSSDVFTADVSASLTGGGGGLTSGSWNSITPTSGTKTIANGAEVAVFIQLTARGGADSVVVSGLTAALSMRYPSSGTFLGGTYGQSSLIATWVLIASDGTLGRLEHSSPIFAYTTHTYNSTSTPNERANLFQLPFPGRVIGFNASIDPDSAFAIHHYSDPLGASPVSTTNRAFDPNVMGAATQGVIRGYFSTPYDFAANEVWAIAVTPSSTSNISAYSYRLDKASFRGLLLGTGHYGVSRSSSTAAFSDGDSGTRIFHIGAIISAFDDGTGSGGALYTHPGMRGRLIT